MTTVVEKTESVASQSPDVEHSRLRRIGSDARAVLLGLDRLGRLLAIHERTNNAVVAAVDELEPHIEALHGEGRDLVIIFAEGHPFVNGTWVRVRKRFWDATLSLTQRFADLGSRGVILAPDLDRESLMELALRLDQRATGTSAEELAEQIQALPGVQLVSAQSVDPRDENQPARSRVLSIFHDAIGTLTAIEGGENVELYLRRHQRGLVQELVHLLETDAEDLLALTALHDLPARACVRDLLLCVHALALGAAVGLGRRQLSRLGMCAISPGRRGRENALDEMRELLGRHGVTSESALGSLVAVEAHLQEESATPMPFEVMVLPKLFAGIIDVAERFTTLTHGTSERSAYLPSDVVELLLREAGHSLDGFLVRTFVRVIGRFPPGAVVTLDTGENAVVMGCGAGMDPVARPRVLLITDAHGVPKTEPVEVDLGDRDPDLSLWRRSIIGARDPAELRIDPAQALFGERETRAPQLLDRDDERLAH